VARAPASGHGLDFVEVGYEIEPDLTAREAFVFSAALRLPVLRVGRSRGDPRARGAAGGERDARRHRQDRRR
jgi:hypothetical protein